MNAHSELEGALQRIVCAAIRNDYGVIICGVRHFDEIMVKNIDHDEVTTWVGGIEQGFVDNKGRFLTREEAWVVAEVAGQIIRPVPGDNNSRLFSENLY